MTSLTSDAYTIYTDATGIQGLGLNYLAPGGPLVVVVYAITLCVLVVVVWDVFQGDRFAHVGWAIWVALAWAALIPTPSPTSPGKRESWVYQQMVKLGDGATMGLFGEIDAALKTDFFDPTTGYADTETAVTPGRAFQFRYTAERILTARLPESLHQKIRNFIAGSPAPCLTRDMVELAVLDQSGLEKRHIDLPGSPTPTIKDCWSFLAEIQGEINTFKVDRFGYEVRSAVRRSILSAAEVAGGGYSRRPGTSEPPDSTIWQFALGARLWLTSVSTLGHLLAFLVGLVAVVCPYVLVSVFARGGWWNLARYFGFFFAARLTGVFYYVVHVLYDRPAFTGLMETDPGVTLAHILKTRIRTYDPIDSAFLASLDNILWLETLFLLACPIAAFLIVFKVILPFVKQRI